MAWSSALRDRLIGAGEEQIVEIGFPSTGSTDATADVTISLLARG
jgi:hypothetical protein